MVFHFLHLARPFRQLAILERCLLCEVGDVGVGTLFLLQEMLFDQLEAVLPVLVALLELFLL